MNRHVMVFGSGGDLPGRIRAVADNIETTLVCRLEHLHRLVEPTGNARVIVLDSDASIEECLRLCLAVHEVHPVTHIATMGEHDQDRAAAVGAELGIYTHSPETVRLTNDKAAMRYRLRGAGIDDTPAGLVADLDELRAFADRHGYPLVVKPVVGMASFGVAVIRGEADLAAGYARAVADHPGVRSRGVLVERFLEGPEYSVEAFSEDSAHVVVAVTAKYKDPSTAVELGHVVPAPLDDDARAAIDTLVTRVLTALGVEFGATHTEIILTGSGPKIIETHVRMGGDDITDLVAGATGVDLIDCQVRQVVGEKLLDGVRDLLAKPREARAEAIWFAAPPPVGELVEVTGAEQAPEPVSITVTAKAGTEFSGLESSYSRPAYARANAPSVEEAVRLAQTAISGLVFVTRVRASVSELASSG